jgi:hypothetical protein
MDSERCLSLHYDNYVGNNGAKDLYVFDMTSFSFHLRHCDVCATLAHAS